MHAITDEDIAYAEKISTYWWSRYDNWRFLERDDAVAIGNLAMCEAARRYRPDGGRTWKQYYYVGIRLWLLGAIMHGHYVHDSIDRIVDDTHDRYGTVQDETDRIHTQMILDQMMDSLNPRYRAAIEMRYLDRYNLNQIKDRLGYATIWSVGDALNRAKKQMRRVARSMGVDDANSA